MNKHLFNRVLKKIKVYSEEIKINSAFDPFEYGETDISDEFWGEVYNINKLYAYITLLNDLDDESCIDIYSTYNIATDSYVSLDEINSKDLAIDISNIIKYLDEHSEHFDEDGWRGRMGWGWKK
ncbi:hypothetical protein pEaSNUABM50_00076 [Erwinia phage pEa_SNUABM_50]|uniref:Uncharacterized protein n=2 Tax=Eneladusvirus BF TaxID=2560751 RepID=A0A7L8ZNP8_9CAUD|nr:hypothetical protein pEaSNUABM47_00077 [Erwinia phage pEa_SNUABM_47]QOI72100.1 hypothetical protein pEaSNUABM50_00076 [Erwinia phage pEa_SNUABM_50]QXO11225.1 hypothetical protein pEaSNUABM19_00079 [Erwinia phage pEa_SNUABM_19]QXO11773.1 hypothetical protein pEaSNUABM44_00077 [Erwinia phage pEa_SNUABM_44]